MNKKIFFLFGLTSFLALLSSPGRAIALPPASALVLASIFTLKLFKTSHFPNCVMDLVHIWWDDRYKSKVSFSNTPAHANDLKIKVTDFEILQIKYYVKVFKELRFSKPNDGCDSDFAWWQIEVQNFIGQYLVYAHAFKVKVTDWNFMFKIF